jgi:hypothetical protein
MTKQHGIWLVLALVGSGVAHADSKKESRDSTKEAAAATKDSKAPLDRFLEQRVAEELAADGTILSRLGVALEIEQVGDHLLVSLVDPATRRTVASTKVDNVPADREAAVASVTQVVANLTTQLSTKPSSGAGEVKAALEQDREDRRAKEAAEFHYKQEAISFGDLYIATTSSSGSTSVSHSMLPYKGGRQLTPEEFFVEVGRQDLADTFHHRTVVGWTGIGIGTAIILGSSIYMVAAMPEDNCDVGSSTFDTCFAKHEADTSRHFKVSLAIGGGGLLVGLVGYYYMLTRNPASKNEIYDMADAHNAKLRQKYNMPGATSAASFRPHLQDVAIAPYATGDGAGLAVAGRF